MREKRWIPACLAILILVTGCGRREVRRPRETREPEETYTMPLIWMENSPTAPTEEETQPFYEDSDTFTDFDSYVEQGPQSPFPEGGDIYAPETVPPFVPPPTEPPYQQERPDAHRNVGLCKNLTRDAMALLVFMNDSESQWTASEVQDYISTMIYPGLGYIQDQAAAWGYGITFDNCVYPDETGGAKVITYSGTVNDWDDDTQNEDLVDQAAAAFGFGSREAMIQNVQNYAGTDQVAIIFCLDKDGRSYSNWNLDNGSYVEHAVLFTHQDGSRRAPDIVAHEVMHLFGAEDMYADRGERSGRAQMAQRLCPTELYYQPQWELYDNTVSSYTAYCVGWLDTVPAEFDCPEWWS